MKTSLTIPRKKTAAFTLIECLAWIALLAVVMECSFKIFFLAWDDNKALQRNANDVVMALHAGDQWRADIREATGEILSTNLSGVEQILIPGTNGGVYYTWAKGSLFRAMASNEVDHAWLMNVKSSHMTAESRNGVPVWRWELELKSPRKVSFCKPLFTFEAVAGGGAQ